jgi:acetyl esterase/lipase
VVDLLRAVRDRLVQQARYVPQDLFLLGFSQGGHASLAALQRLEADPVDGVLPRATASIAGLHALLEISFPAAVDGGSPRSSAYIGYVVTAFARASGQPLHSIAASPWSERLQALFDGSRTLAEVAAVLPADPRDLLLAEVLADIAQRRTTWFAEALLDNSVDGWIPRSPIRFYYGTDDIDASPADAIETAERMRQLGADAQAISVGAADHNSTAFAAVPLVRAWFMELSSAIQDRDVAG